MNVVVNVVRVRHIRWYEGAADSLVALPSHWAASALSRPKSIVTSSGDNRAIS